MACETCCKLEAGVALNTVQCNVDVLSGLKDLRIAVKCAVFNTTIANNEVSDIQMRDLTNDPSCGDDDHQFYQIATKDQTLKHEFTWESDEETDARVYNETIEGQIETRTSATFDVLKSILGKEVVVIGKELGDDGKWIIVGLGGGLKLTQVVGGSGQAKRDSRTTTITITGETENSWMYVWKTDASTTDTLIDSISDV